MPYFVPFLFTYFQQQLMNRFKYTTTMSSTVNQTGRWPWSCCSILTSTLLLLWITKAPLWIIGHESFPIQTVAELPNAISLSLSSREITRVIRNFVNRLWFLLVSKCELRGHQHHLGGDSITESVQLIRRVPYIAFAENTFNLQICPQLTSFIHGQWTVVLISSTDG